MKIRNKKPSRVRAKLVAARARPGRTDPSRTSTLRRAFSARVRRGFARLKGEIVKAIGLDDWLGINSHPLFPTQNAESDCGAGSEGSSGFQPGNTCGAKTSRSENAPRYVGPKEGIVYARIDKLFEHGEAGNLALRYSDKEMRDLVEDVKKNGLRVPVDVIQHRDADPETARTYVSDGRHRLEAAKLAGFTHVPVRINRGRGTRLGSKFTANVRWKPLADPDKIKAFQAWLRSRLGAHVVGKTDEALWRDYAEAGFKKGQARAWDDARRIEKVLAEGGGEPGSGSRKLDFYRGSKDDFLRTAFGRPAAVSKVKMLAGRAFDDLGGITDDMSLRMSRVLADGLTQGASPRDIASDLADEVDLAADRAETIARTEIVRAHAEGQLDSLEALGVTDVGVMVEWSTAGPPYYSELTPKERRTTTHVCRLCEDLEGAVLTIDDARGLLPRHPNCRCAWVPAGVGESDPGRRISRADVEGEDEEVEAVNNRSCPTPLAANVFCPTGEGGGVDPGCSPGEDGSGGTVKTAESEGTSHRVAKVLEEASRIKFSDARSFPRIVGHPATGEDFDEIERSLSDHDRGQLRDHVDRARQDYVDSAADEVETDFDAREAASRLGYGGSDVEVQVERMLESRGVELPERIDVGGRYGAEAVEEAISQLPDDVPQEVRDDLDQYRDDAARDMERAEEQDRESQREYAAERAAEDFDEAEAEREWLRDHWESNREEFSGSGCPPGTWCRDADDDRVYPFETSSGDRYEAVMALTGGKFVGHPVVDFQFTDESGSHKITGKQGARGALEVFAKVTPAAVAFVKEESPPVVTFSAAEPSRQRLYDRLVKTLATAVPEYFAAAVKLDDGTKQYVLARREMKEAMIKHVKERNLAKEHEILVNAESVEELAANADESWWTEEGWVESGTGAGTDFCPTDE